MECEHDKEFFNEMSGQCVVCLEIDLNESRLLYKDAQERATQLRNILTDERAVIIRLTLANDECKAKLERYETALNKIKELMLSETAIWQVQDIVNMIEALQDK